MDLDGAALSHGATRIHPADRACPWQLSPGNVLHRLVCDCTPDAFAGTGDKESTSFSLHPAASGIGGGGTPPGGAAQSTRAVSEVCFVHRRRVAVGG